MAISAPHYRIFKSLAPILPRGGTLLEIGEANWYGDLDPEAVVDEAGDGLSCRVAMDAKKSGDSFAIAKAVYQVIFAPSKIVSIDANGTPAALRHDLNHPLPMVERFDVSINHGTAEHVFNIAQVFATMHRHTKAGGLMIHESPFTGWIDHGFYCLQPTLFYDLAAANCYEVVRVFIEEIQSQTIMKVESREHVHQLATEGGIQNNSMLFVVLRKTTEAPFRIPVQGYYGRTISGEAAKAWENLR